MEAMAGLGLASNVVQFVQFVSELVSTSMEIADSIDGTSQRIIELDKCYTKLSALSSGLQRTSSNATSNADSCLRRLTASLTSLTQESDDELQSHIRSLEDLARDCKVLCEQLLDTVRKLQLDGPRCRPLKSFLVALKTIWSSKKIQSIEERLDRFRSIISLHFFPLLSYQQSAMLSKLNGLRDESLKLRADQAIKLDSLSTGLQELKENLQRQLVRGTDEVARAISSSTSQCTVSSQDETICEQLSQELEHKKLTEEDIQQLEYGFSELLLTQQDLSVVAKEQAFLRSLNFASRTHRHDDIPLAHKETFRWILDSPADVSHDVPYDGALLSTWLSHGDGIFWLTGKAGSGKSTLMKMIARHHKTQELLKQWAGSKKHVVAEHYFWTAGSPIQRSQQGLIQTLLYDIFRMCPEQILQICPLRWSNANSTDPAISEEWTMQELLQTLHQIAHNQALPTRYCVFIDGVDEFDGDHFEICQFLKDLSISQNFKLFVSSRPWNVFEDAFGFDPSRRLCIHDLTRQDILAFAQNRMSEHPRWKEPYFSHDQMQSIITSITDRARGVFLWVFLVTKSLRDGLVNGDTMLDLHRRLESLPTDLETFFKHMMDVVDPLYHKRMARILQIAVNAKQSLSLQFYHMREFEDEDTDYAINKPIEWYYVDTIQQSLDQCRRRINARCGGLLEVKDHRVEFLHRTVRDFLLTRDMSQYLRQKSGRDFMVNLTTLKAFVFLFRFWAKSNMVTRLDIEETEQPCWDWNHALQYANDAIEESEEAAFALLDAVDGHYRDSHVPNDPTLLGVEPHHIFLSELLNVGVDKYVCAKLDEDSWPFDNLSASPLCSVIDQARWSQRHINIIVSLLKSKFDHDAQDTGSHSPWYRLVQRACRSRNADSFRVAMEMSLFSIFLKQGARRDLRVGLSNSLPSSHLIVAMIRQKDSHRFGHHCLRTLDDFLEGESGDVKLQLDEILEIIPAELRKLSTQPTESRKMAFIAQILLRVIRNGIQAGVEMDLIIPQIETSFPGSSGSVLADLIRNKEESRYYSRQPRSLKRRQNGTRSNSPKKRTKVNEDSPARDPG